MAILRQIAQLGQPVLREVEYTDFLARVFQHEFDHLQGMVFVDRVESSLELVTEKEYLRRVQSHA